MNRPTYNIQYGIGRTKYVVNFHDGHKQHADGSPFYDVRLFWRKREASAFIRTLLAAGYAETP